MSQTFPFLPDHNDLQEVRYGKVAGLREAGFDPYPAKFPITHTAAEIVANPDAFVDKEEVVVSALGRAINIRRMGKAAFFHLRDHTGQIQVFLRMQDLPETAFQHYKDFMDHGDIVGVTGVAFITKTGELSIKANDLKLLAKNTRPLPEKWAGLTDKELRYRQRSLDLAVNPDVREVFKTRSKLVSGMRRWLDDQDFLEVETPMMQPLYGGASARPFVTHHNALDMTLYLRIAPELYLKRLVVGGMHRVYEINRNFRNEGVSTQHNPEFTMLELYAAGWDARDMMDFVEQLLQASCRAATGGTEIVLQRAGEEGARHDLAKPFARRTILDLVKEHAGLDLHWSMTREQVIAAAGHHEIPDGIGSGDAIMHLFEELVEHKLLEPTFIIEFPKSLSPLAKSKPDDPEVADRFELYIDGMEIANGYSELNDPAEQYARFKEQVERRKGGDMESVGEVDEDYIRALEIGMPPTAGLGVGIDRFVMLATGSPSIRDVILFPLMRSKGAADAGAKDQPPTEDAS
ncbi:MAG: lysine--tRNA ligase [Sumerlaeia bacterium]